METVAMTPRFTRQERDHVKARAKSYGISANKFIRRRLDLPDELPRFEPQVHQPESEPDVVKMEPPEPPEPPPPYQPAAEYVLVPHLPR